VIHLIRKKKKSKDRTVRVIVQFKQKVCNHHIRELRKKASPHRIQGLRRLNLIKSVAARVHCDCLPSLLCCKGVRRIIIDRKKRALLSTAVPTVGARAAQKSGWTGKGITIAVLDTGIYPHLDLTRPKNRIVAFRDFIKNRKKPYDDNGHGTHCAGDAAGNGRASKGVYKGAAPSAKLAGVKVLDRDGGGYDSDIIRGIQWCLTNRRKYGIRILSLSFGGAATLPCSQDPLCQAVENAWRRGLVVVAASGNEGPKSRTINSPGISPRIITVGATNDQGRVRPAENKVASFSSRGPTEEGVRKPDLVAPGANITSLRAPGSRLDRDEKKMRVGRWYFKMSGTSMATPIVAGVIAQILQRYPRLTPNQVKALLKRRARNLGAGSNVQGSGLVRVGRLG
jgi:serine protease AprX